MERIERLKEELSFRRRLEACLYRLSREASEKKFEELGRELIRSLKRLTNSPLALVGMWDELTQSWYFPNFVDRCYRQCKIRTVRIPCLGGVFAKALEEKRTYIANCLTKDSYFKGLPKGHIPIERVAIYPIWRQGRPKGLLAIANAPKRYTRREKEALEKLGEFYGLLLETKQQERQREEEKLFLKALYEEIGFGLALWNVAQRPPRKLFANRDFEAIQEAFGSRLGPLLAEAQGLSPGEILSRHCKLSNPRETHYLCTLKKLSPDLVLLAAQDVSQELKVQEELSEAEKAKTLNVLAGNLAHKFNNLLNVIISSLEILKTYQQSPEIWIHKAEFAAQDLAILVRQLLLYARGEVLGKKTVDLKDFLPRVIKFLRALLPPHLRLRLKMDQDLPPAKIDPLALEQILVNLVINAAEAYGEDPGIITLSIALNASHKHEKASRSPYKVRFCSQTQVKRWIAIEVKDQGRGIPPEILPHVLEPFYSTKGLGRGLGLAAVKAMVYAHEGCMVIYSRPGRGTRFKILIPINHIEEP